MDDIRTDSSPSLSTGSPAPPFDLYVQHSTVTRRRVRYAGFGRRFVAVCIDGLLLGVVNYVVIRFLNNIFESANSDTESGLYYAAWIVVVLCVLVLLEWLYYAGMEGSDAQATLGKSALGIVVTDLDGNRISFGRATARFFARYLSLFSFMIGYLIQPFTTKRQALHDLIAGTLVVRSE